MGPVHGTVNSIMDKKNQKTNTHLIDDNLQVLVDDPHYKTVMEIIQKLDQQGVLELSQGNCVGTCDIMQKLLNSHGIKSKIVETALTIVTLRRGQDVDYKFMGHDNLSFPGQIDTHTVLITDTPIPMLIDLTISRWLPPGHPYVVEKVNSLDPAKISEYILGHDGETTVTYAPKTVVRLPGISQLSMLERIANDTQTSNKIRRLSIMFWVLVAVGISNVLFNLYQILFH
jgi:hypothetical protein